MSFLGTAITAGTSLLGASKSRKTSAAMWLIDGLNNLPSGIRRNAEEAGFNPLAFVGPGVGTGAQYQPIMGNGIAQAGAAIGDYLSEEAALRRQRSELEQENQRLNELVHETTLKEEVPGIYGSKNAVQNNRRDSSDRVDIRRGDTSDDQHLGASGSVVAPGREIEVAPFTSSSGLTEINNAATLGPVVVPGDDGEPWGIDELLTAAIFSVPQLGVNAGKRIGEYLDERAQQRRFDRLYQEQEEDEGRKPKRKPPRYRPPLRPPNYQNRVPAIRAPRRRLN